MTDIKSENNPSDPPRQEQSTEGNGGQPPEQMQVGEWNLGPELNELLAFTGPASETLFKTFIETALKQKVAVNAIVQVCQDRVALPNSPITKYVYANGGEVCVKTAIERAPAVVKRKVGAGRKKKSSPAPAQSTAGNGNGQPRMEVDYSDPGFGFDNIAFAPDIPTAYNTPPLETIQIRGETAADIARIVNETVDALVAHNIPIFKRGFILVMPIWQDRPINKTQMVKVATLVTLNESLLELTLNKYQNSRPVEFLKMKKVMLPSVDNNPRSVIRMTACGAPHKVLKVLLEAKHWKIKPITGLINCPTLRPDGTLLANAGYDEATKFYAFWDDALVLPPIADQPSKEDAEQALQCLVELLAGFPFVEELDKAVAIAAILTAVLRPAVDLVPIFLLLAAKSGTGKSYLQDLITTIVTGRSCPVISNDGKREEIEKRLGALLLQGDPVIAIDNMDQDLKSVLLCQIATQRTVAVRILGKSEMPQVEYRGIIFCNGNNITVVGDLVRRTLISNMIANVTKPWTRDFSFSPIERVLQDRGKYIAAAITIARAYQVCAKDDKVKLTNFGGFDDWSRLVREALVWLKLPDVIDSQEQAERDDPVGNAALDLIQAWKDELTWVDAQTSPEQRVVKSYKTADLIAAANETKGNPVMVPGQQDWLFARPTLHAQLVAHCGEVRGGNIDLKKLSQWLRSLQNQLHTISDDASVEETFRIIIARHDEKRGHRWQLEKVDDLKVAPTGGG